MSLPLPTIGRMAKSGHSKRLDQVTFRCGSCKWVFSERPLRIDDAPERAWHPYLYFCKRPVCGEEAEQVSREKALRTRFNGIKHGLSAKTTTYFPAKPDLPRL